MENLILFLLVLSFVYLFLSKNKPSLMLASSLVILLLIFKYNLGEIFVYLKNAGLSTMISLFLGMFLLGIINFIIYLALSKIRKLIN
jgi:hypothetical protein